MASPARSSSCPGSWPVRPGHPRRCRGSAAGGAGRGWRRRSRPHRGRRFCPSRDADRPADASTDPADRPPRSRPRGPRSPPGSRLRPAGRSRPGPSPCAAGGRTAPVTLVRRWAAACRKRRGHRSAGLGPDLGCWSTAVDCHGVREVSLCVVVTALDPVRIQSAGPSVTPVRGQHRQSGKPQVRGVRSTPPQASPTLHASRFNV